LYEGLRCVWSFTHRQCIPLREIYELLRINTERTFFFFGIYLSAFDIVWYLSHRCRYRYFKISRDRFGFRSTDSSLIFTVIGIHFRYLLWRGCMFVVIFFVVVCDMTGRRIGSQAVNAAVTVVDPSELMQSPPISGFVQTPNRSVVARCTPIQSMSSDVTRCSPSTGKCQVVIRRPIPFIKSHITSQRPLVGHFSLLF